MNLLGERTWRGAAWVMFGLALTYAFVAGLRTVADFDVGWLLATGRHLVTHHEVPRVEALSYTANGTPWIYPPFGGAALYLVYAAGGFAALSWINALASAAVVAVAVGRPRLLTCALAILAVPSIALRTAPRAELFTVLFFAVFLSLLWKHRRDGKSPLWLLPVVMLAWVNCHPGFAVGLAVLGAYAVVELLECCSPSRRAEAVTRLKAVAPWAALSLVATFVNPWGVRIYQALAAQNRVTPLHSVIVGEWSGVRLTAASVAGALQLRDPNSSYWWLLVFAVVAAMVALWRRQFGNAAMLVAAAWLSVQHLRFQALFAIVVIVVSREVFDGSPVEQRRVVATLARGAAFGVSLLALLHIADTVSNRSYLANGELSEFGAGLSWWYPQRAADFIEKNALPGQLFHGYNDGGYITLRLGPRYLDYADGRAIPFGADVLTAQSALVQTPPDSPRWMQETDRYGINTILLSLARVGGLESVPLTLYCGSHDWKPVYLDEVSVVLVRNQPENQRWLSHTVDCATHQLALPVVDANSERGRAELYNFYANAASIYYVLGRDRDAIDAIGRAETLFADDPNLALLAGQLLQANGQFAEAETQYRRALHMRESDNGWYLLARLMLAQKNYSEAAQAMQHSADLAVLPADRYRTLGDIRLAINKPRQALAAFDSAERFGRKLAPLPSYPAFRAQLAEGRSRAWLALHDTKRATAFAEESTRLAPAEPQRWNLLAECYAAQGLAAEAEQARQRSKELSPQK